MLFLVSLLFVAVINISLAWPYHFLGAGHYRLQYKCPHPFPHETSDRSPLSCSNFSKFLNIIIIVCLLFIVETRTKENYVVFTQLSEMTKKEEISQYSEVIMCTVYSLSFAKFAYNNPDHFSACVVNSLVNQTLSWGCG